MKHNTYLVRILLLGLCAAILFLTPGLALSTAAAGTLADYRAQAKTLAAELDTRAVSSGVLDDFNALYKKGDYQGAYDYYLTHKSSMIKSCWYMNNVGLAMLQLQKNDEALVLYMAIQYKAREEQPESLINLLVAGHALGFGPKELLDEVNMTASLFQKYLKAKKYGKSAIDGMIRSLCYNVIYMKIEDPSVTAKTSKSTAKPDLAALLKDSATGAKMMATLRYMAKTDEDAKALLAYFEALLKLRRENAKT